MPIGDMVAIRITARQRTIIEKWLADHPGTEDLPVTASDALRAAIDALDMMERRRANQRANRKQGRLNTPQFMAFLREQRV